MGDATKPAERLLPIDQVRGLALVLMVVDHASAFLNQGRVMPGSRNLAHGMTSFPVAQFFLRWATHFCPVAFVFLAGLSLVLATRRRTQRGEPAGAIDRFLVTRGLFILLLDVAWMNAGGPRSGLHLDVLTAIGCGIAAMAFLRHLAPAWLAALAAGLVLTPELGDELLPTGLANLLWDGGAATQSIFLNYAVLPWVGVLALGWCWGEIVLGPSIDVERLGERARATLVPLFLGYLALRGLNAFGNARAPRLDASLQQWLDVSKNPPSLAFLCLETSFLGACLAGFSRLSARGDRFPVLLTFGRTALFFYVIHFQVLHAAAALTGTGKSLGIPGTLLGACLLLLFMYPLCRWYERWAAGHDNLVTRYL